MTYKVLSTLIELQRLKRLDRTGWTLRGLPNGTESVAAHSFGVAVTAMTLADELRSLGVPVDTERLLRMALLHDWAETRVGDYPKQPRHIFAVISESGQRVKPSLMSFVKPEVRSLCTVSFMTNMNGAKP